MGSLVTNALEASPATETAVASDLWESIIADTQAADRAFETACEAVIAFIDAEKARIDGMPSLYASDPAEAVTSMYALRARLWRFREDADVLAKAVKALTEGRPI